MSSNRNLPERFISALLIFFIFLLAPHHSVLHVKQRGCLTDAVFLKHFDAFFVNPLGGNVIEYDVFNMSAPRIWRRWWRNSQVFPPQTHTASNKLLGPERFSKVHLEVTKKTLHEITVAKEDYSLLPVGSTCPPHLQWYESVIDHRVVFYFSDWHTEI